VSGTYREETSFEVATGPRALAELRRAARPGLPGWEVMFVIAAVGVLGVIASGRWHDLMGFCTSGAVLLLGWTGAKLSRTVARKQAEHVRRTRGWLEEDGVVLESDGGASARWSWDRITFARRTRTALAIFSDTDWAFVILAEQTPNLDRIAEIASARARAPMRAPSRWMLAVVLVQIVLTCIALRPQPLDTPLARIEDALDRHVAAEGIDIDALAYGSLCDRVALASLATRHHELAAGYAWDDERATVLVAQDTDVCAEGAVTPRGRVLLDDAVLGTCTYYVFTLRGRDGFVLAGPYGFFEDEAWTHPEPGTLYVDRAMQAASAMHLRLTDRPPSDVSFALALRDEDETE